MTSSEEEIISGEMSHARTENYEDLQVQVGFQDVMQRNGWHMAERCGKTKWRSMKCMKYQEGRSKTACKIALTIEQRPRENMSRIQARLHVGAEKMGDNPMVCKAQDSQWVVQRELLAFGGAFKVLDELMKAVRLEVIL